MEEKLKFLEGRLTEEELGEVRKRMSETAAGTTNGTTSTSAVVATKSRDSVMQNVKDSPVAE
jgi:hypothetical protein